MFDSYSLFFSFYHVCSYVTQFNNYYFSQAEYRERELGEKETTSLLFFFDVHVRRTKVLTDAMRMYARDSMANTKRFSLN